MSNENTTQLTIDETTSQGELKGKRSRQARPFPAGPFKESLEFAKEMYRLSGNQPIRRLTLFDELGKSPDSSASRMLLTNAAKYGLTKGSYVADFIELTPEGVVVSNEETPARESARVQTKLVIDNIPVMKALFDKFTGNKLPTLKVLVDAAKEQGLTDALAAELADTFLVNLRTLGLLITVSGTERVVSVEHMLDSLPSTTGANVETRFNTSSVIQSIQVISETQNFDSVCFYVTAIGDEGSEYRKHSDLFLGSLVEPALEPFGLRVVRADKIDKPGMITKQIIDHIVHSRLVIADLSFHNPNVFYELAIRHAFHLPTVQIIRKQDRIPFDVGQARTIVIDSSDIYSFVPKLDVYRAEIASQVRRALDEGEGADNPISMFYPALKATSVKTISADD